MIDLYLIITPLGGLLLLLTVVTLKFALNQPKTDKLSKYQRKKPQSTDHQIEHSVKEQVKDNLLQPGFKKTLIYLLKNFTIAQFCLIRRTRNKIPLILSTSIIALLSITINLPYAFCFIGSAITFIFLFSKMLTDKQQQTQSDIHSPIVNQQVKRQEKFEQKLEIILTSLSLIINLLFIGIAFKNYRNNLLYSAIQNFFITMAIDNFALKPILLAMTAFLIKNVVFVDAYIEKQTQLIEILHGQRVIKKSSDNAFISALSPRKQRTSPSKVPKAMRINLESTDNYIAGFELTKNLYKPKLSPIKNDRNQGGQEDCSLISIMNSQQKKNGNNHISCLDQEKSLFQQKVNCQQGKAIVEENKDRVQKEGNGQSLKLVVISNNHSFINEIDIQNQENAQSANQKQSIDNQNKTISRNCDGMKIYLNSVENQNSYDDTYDDLFKEDRNTYQVRPYTSMEEDNSIIPYNTITNTSRRHGLLKINQDKRAEDLEEIDLNSPERRKQKISKMDENAEIIKKKKKNQKKYSLDPNRHVIKHSTGEPYLEFLPNLLNKERQQKKKNSYQGSQNTFSRRVDLMNGCLNETRLTKSVKKQKNTKELILKGNDENKIPEFVIEDFN